MAPFVGSSTGATHSGGTVMADRIKIRFGEAMGAGSEDWLWTEPEIAIGETDGPVGQAFANLMGQTAGFSRFFCLVDGGKMVKPATLMVPKVQLKKMADMQDANLNEVYRNNRSAMREAIEKALKGKPSVADLLKEDRRQPRHMYYN